MARSVFYDGLNLALATGTGVATYTRGLIKTSRRLGYQSAVIHSTASRVPRDPVLREIMLFDEDARQLSSGSRRLRRWMRRKVAAPFGRKPTPIALNGTVVLKSFNYRLEKTDSIFADEDLFAVARSHFRRYNARLNLSFDKSPDIFHCTYPLPLRIKKSANVYTIHDLVPLRLPYLSDDDKRYHYNLLKTLVRQADHIVTVSEASRRDILTVLGADEKRVTNTYQAVDIPQELIDKSEDVVADEVSGIFNLDWRRYFLFFGALEPKKNVMRLAEAYLASKIDLPLVVVGAPGWKSEREREFMEDAGLGFYSFAHGKIQYHRRIKRFPYVPYPLLVSLIRGARAVLFPSLYEGFGLPVLEAMQLGTPVIASTEGSIPEVAADAGLLVDPYDANALSRAIVTLASDGSLCAQMSKAGLERSARFSSKVYEKAVGALYERILQ
jgi:glycosyltransferase involved in cell wall biosynthesis